jgi:hypothetical protein
MEEQAFDDGLWGLIGRCEPFVGPPDRESAELIDALNRAWLDGGKPQKLSAESLG